MAKIKYIKIAGSAELIPFEVEYDNTIDGETTLADQATEITEEEIKNLCKTAFDN